MKTATKILLIMLPLYLLYAYIHRFQVFKSIKLANGYYMKLDQKSHNDSIMYNKKGKVILSNIVAFSVKNNIAFGYANVDVLFVLDTRSNKLYLIKEEHYLKKFLPLIKSLGVDEVTSNDMEYGFLDYTIGKHVPPWLKKEN